MQLAGDCNNIKRTYGPRIPNEELVIHIIYGWKVFHVGQVNVDFNDVFQA